MIYESQVEDKWPLHSVFKINGNKETFPSPTDQTSVPWITKTSSSYSANRLDTNIQWYNLICTLWKMSSRLSGCFTYLATSDDWKTTGGILGERWPRKQVTTEQIRPIKSGGHQKEVTVSTGLTVHDNSFLLSSWRKFICKIQLRAFLTKNNSHLSFILLKLFPFFLNKRSKFLNIVYKTYLDRSFQVWFLIPEIHLTGKRHHKNWSKTKPFHFNQIENVSTVLENQS
jgi:hypothetical protein